MSGIRPLYINLDSLSLFFFFVEEGGGGLVVFPEMDGVSLSTVP